MQHLAGDERPLTDVRVIYAANRAIGLSCLRALLDEGITPCALLIPEGSQAEYVTEMRELLSEHPVIEGLAFREPESVELLRELEPDYLVSVHFPYIIPSQVLSIPTVGNLNLHPAYLPYNRGWHTPSWAILEDTVYGATLHWIDEGVDTGDIALQEKIEVLPEDTAHSLYQRVLHLEEELFRKAIPLLRTKSLPRRRQEGTGTSHSKADLRKVQQLDLNQRERIGELLRRLRALTTNRWEEAAFFEVDGRRYRIRVEIRPEDT